MLYVYEKEAGWGITRPIKRYVETNEKYLKKFDQSKYSSFIKYLEFKNQYGDIYLKQYLMEDLNGLKNYSRLMMNLSKLRTKFWHRIQLSGRHWIPIELTKIAWKYTSFTKKKSSTLN